ncbi:MAG: hypothetical protein Q4F67_13810, partial [Propionibacteriaceae bacterium]|nr:hypothetical protein [Propionibacteriaceae bacterium]
PGQPYAATFGTEAGTFMLLFFGFLGLLLGFFGVILTLKGRSRALARAKRREHPALPDHRRPAPEDIAEPSGRGRMEPGGTPDGSAANPWPRLPRPDDR